VTGAGDGALERYRERKVAVIGATGFIGRWVAEALSRCGAHVALLARDIGRAEKLRSQLSIAGLAVACDVTDIDSVANAVGVIRPSIVFNLAGYGVAAGEREEAEYFRVNADFVRELCAVLEHMVDASWSGRTLVHAGSQLEYGPIGGNLREDSIASPVTVYGRSKLEGTRAVAEAGERGLGCVTARVFNVYGPGEHEGRLLASLLSAAVTGEPVALSHGTQRLDFAYVEDVAEGLLRLGGTLGRRGEVVNLATGKLTSVREFALAAAKVLELPEERLQFGAIDARAEDIQYDPVWTGRLRELTGWTPSSNVESGVRRTLGRVSHVTR
jgi:nucleoside-diphosphate-sugar epimerase